MDSNLAEFFSVRLRKIAAENIVLDATQVISVIGREKAEELYLYVVSMTTDMQGKKKRRSAIPAHKRFKVNGLAKFNRLELIKAIDEARAAQGIHPRGISAGSEGDKQRDSARTESPTDPDNRS